MKMIPWKNDTGTIIAFTDPYYHGVYNFLRKDMHKPGEVVPLDIPSPEMAADFERLCEFVVDCQCDDLSGFAKELLAKHFPSAKKRTRAEIADELIGELREISTAHPTKCICCMCQLLKEYDAAGEGA
jgi:hypothetical protein